MAKEGKQFVITFCSFWYLVSLILYALKVFSVLFLWLGINDTVCNTMGQECFVCDCWWRWWCFGCIARWQYVTVCFLLPVFVNLGCVLCVCKCYTSWYLSYVYTGLTFKHEDLYQINVIAGPYIATYFCGSKGAKLNSIVTGLCQVPTNTSVIYNKYGVCHMVL
jgi:hypothetical protein